MDKKIIIAIGAAVTGLVVLRYALFSEPDVAQIKPVIPAAGTTTSVTTPEPAAATSTPAVIHSTPASSGPSAATATGAANPANQISEPVIKPNSGATPPTGPAATLSTDSATQNGPAISIGTPPEGNAPSIGTAPDANAPSIASPPTGERPILSEYQGEGPRGSAVSGVAGSAAPGLSPSESRSTGPVSAP